MTNSDPCQLVELYYDDLLTSEQASGFEEHLSDCQWCKQQLSELQGIDRDIALAWNQVSLPEVSKVDVSLETVPSSVTIRRPAIWQILALSLCLLLAAFWVGNGIVNPERRVARGSSDTSARDPEEPSTTPSIADSVTEDGQTDTPPAFVRARESTAVAPVARTSRFTVYKLIPQIRTSVSEKE